MDPPIQTATRARLFDKGLRLCEQELSNVDLPAHMRDTIVKPIENELAGALSSFTGR